MKIFNSIIHFLITIGCNSERRKSRIDYGNMGIIIFYFVQLIGCVFSRFQSKSAKFYENEYLAQIVQYSSLPYLIINIHFDAFIILMFGCIFIFIVLIYVVLLLQIYYKPLDQTHIVNRFIKFYFQNFQWYFLTPFHECMVGVKTCGSLAYLKMYSDMENCWQQISLWFMIPSLVGQFLLILSGFLSLYCFRNYEFIQGDLMRKFTILNFLTIILHMILQMCNFWRDLYMYSDIIKHLVLILILFIHSVDSYMNLPFGYSNETIFFSKILGCSTFFEILVAIWIFSNNNDGIIFLTFSIFAPLIFVVIESYFDRYFDKECTNYCLQKECFNSDYIFEYLCQLSGQEFAQKDCLIVLKYMQLHCQECREVLCPCRQKIQKFVTGQYTLNVTLIYLWIQFQFQKAIKFIIENKLDYEIFESLGIKFVTFLQRYRENQILSQKIIQDILFIYQKLPKHSYPYFFLNLTKIIQNKNKVEMEMINRGRYSQSKTEFKTLNDINLFYIYEEEMINLLKNAVKKQRHFWKYSQQSGCGLFEFLIYSKQIYDSSQLLKAYLKKFSDLRFIKIQDSILIQRMKLLISLVCMDDLNATVKLAVAISKEENESSASRPDQINFCQFLNGQAISIISQVSNQTLGYININDQLNQFFGYEPESQDLKTIDQLLPSKIGLIHNGLIENFLQRGNSSRLNSNSEQFILNKQNFIEKVTICLNVVFPLINDDYKFYMIGHLLKKYTKYQLDQNRKGYILVDSEFMVFGLTKNIYDKVCLQTQENIIIFQLIPDLHYVMEQYFKIRTLSNEKRIKSQAQICLRESGFMGNYEIKRNINHTSVEKYTNKYFVNILKDQKSSTIDYKTSQKIYPIEFSVAQKVLTPIINDQVKEFVYFVVEIDFQEDLKIGRKQSQLMIQEKILLKTIKEDAHLHSNVILSNDENENNEQVDLIVDMSNTGSLKNQSELVNRIQKVEGQISNKSAPESLKNLIHHFVFQLLLFLVVITIISILFKHKKDLQSDCIEQITLDLNFLDAYSSSMAGSRHTILFRDFYPIVRYTVVIINETKVNLTKYDKMYMAWQQLDQGLVHLIDMYQNYSLIVENSRVKLLNLYYINYDLNSKLTQPIESFATYYQIMLEIFYMTFKSFIQSPDGFLSGSNDPYSIRLARSIIYYNFLDVATNANSTLDDCKIYNTSENNYFDSIIIIYYIVMYILLFVQFFSIIFFYLRVTKTIQQYFKLLNLCDQEDYTHAISRCDYLLTMLQYDRILLRKKQFHSILSEPANIFDNLRKTQNQLIFKVTKKSKKAEILKDHSKLKSVNPILVIMLISCIQFLYVFSFQLYYSDLQNNIQPINNRALIAQQMRLNFILSVNRFDLFLIKSYFTTYNETQFSKNLYADTLILKQLDINSSIIKEDVNTLQQINFAELLFEDSSSSQLSYEKQQQLLGGDVCLLTGCNMQSQQTRKVFYQYFAPLFDEGIVSLHTTILQFIKGSATLIEQNAILNHHILETILEDPTYIIYFVWGMDAIQYQISQFSQYFIDISLNILIQLTSYNQISIILIGVGLIIVIFIIQQMFIKQQYRKYLYSKQMIRIVPLPILFQRNIPKHLLNFERKHKYF